MIVGGLITLIVLGIGISWVVNSTPPVEAPPSVPGSVVMPPRPAGPVEAPATEAAPATEGSSAIAEPAAPATSAAAPNQAPNAPAVTAPAVAAPQAAQAPMKGAPAATAPVSPAAAPVSPSARFLQDATAALATGDLVKAAQLLDQAARLEPGNAEIGARKAEIDARLAILARRFSPGATTTLGGRSTKGPSGFDLGGGTATRTDYAAQIRCGVTPASVEPGLPYTARCSIVNIGQKAFRLESITATEAADGARSAFAGTAPPRDLAPQGEAMILEKTGTWSARSQWSLEVVAKTNREESFKVAHTWR